MLHRLLLLVFSTVVCHAQGQYATISGVLTDSSGALVAGAAVRATNIATGEHHTAASTASGVYTLPLLLPGQYTFMAEHAGFKRYERTAIKLETGGSVRIDVTLEVGAITDSIRVDATAPLLQSESSSVGAVIQNDTIANMPLVDRRAAQLARLSGFVVQNGTGSQFSMGGGRGNNTQWIIDGGSVQNTSLGTQTLTFDPPVESLQEFNVSVSNYAAELGRTGGGVVQMTTKSGTNQFHGAAYEYVRNDAFDARSFFSTTKTPLRYNLFGAALGGPIKRNRTFFFYNYEGRRTSSSSTVFENIPTREETRGDFSANRTVIRDPSTAARAPFPGNIIPAARFDPIGSALAAFYPAPNVAGRASGSSNFYAVQVLKNPADTHVTRIDHSFSERDRIYGRFLVNRDLQTRPAIFPTAGTDDYGRTTPGRYYNVSGTWFHNLTPSTIHEFRSTFDKRLFINQGLGIGSGIAGKLGIGGVDPENFPVVTVNGYNGLGVAGNRLQTPIYTFGMTDHVTRIQGNHSLKAGLEYRMAQNDDLQRNGSAGTFNFGSTATGNGIAAMLLGWTQTASRQENQLLRTRMDTYGAFLQDDWKVTPKLTLNIGVRYDLDQPRWEKIENRQNSFNRTTINPVSGTPGVITFPGRNGLSKYANDWDKNNLGPRFGFAWRPAEHWVVRGGGAAVFTGSYDVATPNAANLGFNLSVNLVSPDNGITPALILKNGLPPLKIPTDADRTPGFGAVPIGAASTNSPEFFERDHPNGYMETLNFNIQRELSRTMLIEVGYLATLGHKLPMVSNLTINQVPQDKMGPGNAQLRRPFPQFSDVTVNSSAIGNSNYHAGNVRLEKRASHGLHFQTNYTWSRMIDDAESRNEPGGTQGGGFTNIYDRKGDRGLSGWSISHRAIFSSVYAVPVGRGRSVNFGNGAFNALLGGWTAGYIAEVRSGLPYGVIEQTNTTNAFSPSQRPNVAGDPRITADRTKGQQLDQWFNTAAFAAPALYTFGNGGRTNGFGPGAIMMDLSILKDFAIREKQTLQFRTEMLNFINRANFALPNLLRGNAAFGRITSLIDTNQNRIVQFSLYYKF